MTNRKGDNLCCEHILRINFFASFVTGELFEIFHQLICKSHSLIYLPPCCELLLQFVDKSKTNFNRKLYTTKKTLLKLKISYCLINIFKITITIFR